MDVKALETFEVIVRTGSFVKAAQELKYVQSTVTSQIQKLEEDLGIPAWGNKKTGQIGPEFFC